jgi:hypothetical protein
MKKVKFTSASKKENGKAATTTVDSLFDALTGSVDPLELSKICRALSKQGTEAILDIEGYPVVFKANRADTDTLRASCFPAVLKAPKTGKNGPVLYKVNSVRVIKTVTGV